MTRRQAQAAALALLLVAAAIRLVGPANDPPLDYGPAHLTDEGYYTKNAKELVRSGSWTWHGDDHNHVYLAPLTASTFALGFAVLTPSLAAARFLVAIAAILVVLLAGTLLRPHLDREMALLGLAWLAVEPALVVLGRTALAEGFLLLASLGVAAALAHDLDRGGLPVRTWLTFALALLVKASAVALVPVITAAVVLWAIERRAPVHGIRRLLLFLAGPLVAVAVWYLAYIRPVANARFMFDYEFGAHVAGEGLLGPLVMLARSLETQHLALGFLRDPVLLGLGGLALVVVALEALRGLEVSGLDRVAASWLGAQGLFFSAVPYQPPRYFMPLAVPALLLVLPLLAGRGSHRFSSRLERALPAASVLAPLITAVGTAVALRSSGLVSSVLAIGLGLGAGIVIVHLARIASEVGADGVRPAGARGRSGSRARLGLAAALVVPPALVVLAWLAEPRASMIAVSRDLARRLGPDDVVIGYFAATFTLDSAARAAVVHGPWNRPPGALARLRATHLLVREEELRWLVDRDPALEHRLLRLATYAPAGGARGRLTLYGIERSRGDGSSGRSSTSVGLPATPKR